MFVMLDEVDVCTAQGERRCNVTRLWIPFGYLVSNTIFGTNRLSKRKYLSRVIKVNLKITEPHERQIAYFRVFFELTDRIYRSLIRKTSVYNFYNFNYYSISFQTHIKIYIVADNLQTCQI